MAWVTDPEKERLKREAIDSICFALNDIRTLNDTTANLFTRVHNEVEGAQGSRPILVGAQYATAVLQDAVRQGEDALREARAISTQVWVEDDDDRDS